MAYIQFYSSLPVGFRLKDLFVAPATGIALAQDLSPNLATFSVRAGWSKVPVTYYGTSLSLTQGSVSAITFGNDDNPWIVFGSAGDPVTRFTYGNGLAAFQGSGAAAAAVIMAGADHLRGSSRGDYLDGYAGNDTLNGGAGDDTMVGGTGDDTYYVNSQNDRAVEYYQAGIDTVIAGASYTLGAETYVEILRAAAGTKQLALTGNKYANHLIGNDGANTLTGGGGSDTLEGGRGNDTYTVSSMRTMIIEERGGGTDTVLISVDCALPEDSFIENLKATGGKALELTGNSLANTITGNDAANLLGGMEGSDTLYGGKGGDTLYGGEGNDALYGGDGMDRLYGQNGNDKLYGGGSDGFLYGGSGADALYGAWGNDRLSGDAGNDKLYGDTGNDTLYGGAGNDTLASGEGYDAFVFNTSLAQDNVDTLTDFNAWADQIRLSQSVFGGIGSKGALRGDKFWIGAKAHDSSDRIIYDRTTGALYYDPDGTGHEQQIKFAVIGKTELSAAAFLVI